MSSQIRTTLAKRRMQNLETLPYYVFSTLFPLQGYLDNQHGEFLESWMAYLEFDKFPNLIKHYTTIGNGALLKEEYTTIKILHYLWTSKILCTTPNHISTLPTKSYIMSTLISWPRIPTQLLVNILPYVISCPSHKRT